MGTLNAEQLAELRGTGTCLVASAIERFQLRLANVGFSNSAVHCIFPEKPALLGYAATARIKTALPPMEGRNYYEHTDWWNHILSVPEPRVVVIEDVDNPAGLGGFVGEVNTCILISLGCTGLVTNGAVRDLPQVERTGFQMFAGNVSASHAYAHVFDFGGTVEVAGMKINPGELLHGDRHGVVNVPLEIAADIPRVARNIVARRQQLTDFCRSADFSLGQLRQAIQDTDPYKR